MLNFLQINFPILITYKYLFLYIGSSIEGMNIMILGGFLASAGFVRVLPAFLVLIIGEMTNGYIWYTVGYFAGSKPIDKWGRSKPESEKIINTVEHYFEQYSGRALLITKFTFSFTIATEIIAGSLKYNLRKFSFYNFIGSIGWVSMTMFTGYFFGQSYKLFLGNIIYFTIFLAGAVALIYILKFTFKSAFIKSILEHERVRYYRGRIKNGLDKFISEKE